MSECISVDLDLTLTKESTNLYDNSPESVKARLVAANPWILDWKATGRGVSTGSSIPKPPEPVTVVVGGLYQHMKTGGVYRVLQVGKMEATLEKVVVYQLCDLPKETVWVRPYDEFVDGRFTER